MWYGTSCTESPLKCPALLVIQTPMTNTVYCFVCNCQCNHVQHLSSKGLLVNDASGFLKLSRNKPTLFQPIPCHWCTAPLVKKCPVQMLFCELLLNLKVPQWRKTERTVSVPSALSSTANEYAPKSLALSFSWICKSEPSSSTQLATVFRERLMLSKAYQKMLSNTTYLFNAAFNKSPLCEQLACSCYLFNNYEACLHSSLPHLYCCWSLCFSSLTFSSWTWFNVWINWQP